MNLVEGEAFVYRSCFASHPGRGCDRSPTCAQVLCVVEGALSIGVCGLTMWQPAEVMNCVENGVRLWKERRALVRWKPDCRKLGWVIEWSGEGDEENGDANKI